MKILFFYSITALFLAFTNSYAQNWVVPENGAPVSDANNMIGITGTALIPRHLQIAADNNSEIQFLTGSPATRRLTIAADGKVFIGSVISPSGLEITGVQGGPTTLLLKSPVYHGGTSRNEILFSSGAGFSQSTGPTYGNGALEITNNVKNGARITLYNNEIDFGGLLGAGVTAGKYNFNGLVWAGEVYVSDYSNPDSVFSKPEGYRFAVNGTSNFQDKMVIGHAKSFIKGFPDDYKLFVADGILSEKFKCAIKTTNNWSDFVFAPGYKLMQLDQVEAYIGKNGHLPDIPSAREVVKNGLDLGQMDALLLQKIEELTLHIIQLKKENKEILKELDSK